jgi:hypothetical protein
MAWECGYKAKKGGSPYNRNYMGFKNMKKIFSDKK